MSEAFTVRKANEKDITLLYTLIQRDLIILRDRISIAKGSSVMFRLMRGMLKA